MFGLGKQKKDAYQESIQDDYYYDEYDNEGYEEDYGYDSYQEEGYERPVDSPNGYDRGEHRSRRRTAAPVDERYEARYEEDMDSFPAQKAEKESRREPDTQLQQEVERLEETVAQLKHQLEVKQAEMTGMATTLTEKEQELHEQQAKSDQQLEAFREEKEEEQKKLQAEKDRQIQELTNQVAQLNTELQDDRTNQTEALVQAKRQIESLKQTQKENEDMKAELATILIETKKQERATLERAEYEAKGIRSQAEQEAHQVIHDASLELRVMKQEIRNYRKRLRSVQEETTQFFVRLLATSDNLLDDE
ncbi:hypothetical protein [Enterococcus sp. AZ072]|uniref:hypothetical protein n=1 Tax=unclassified Enterococcus TaxID=2608891 RepID=UPI003D2955D4